MPEELSDHEPKDIDVIRAEVDQIADKLGTPIDDRIKETVVALKLNGFETSGSCEGHLDGFPLPYVDIETDEPEGWRDNPVLQAQWRERNLQQRARFEPILVEFNQHRDPNHRLGLQERGIYGAFKVQPGSTPDEVTAEQLTAYQEDMAAFSRYLIDRA
ncbi:MAG TPA: hypothetical protein VLE72_02250 [Candidatus Saccharimonadales bacterium]|nr:hypothetical protein [Candidatus Saccharimonadales bacterium]